jgi:hypothetical protein
VADHSGEPRRQGDAVAITNCHVHSFTVAHTPDRFLPWPVPLLVRFSLVRRLLAWVASRFDPQRKTA